MAIDISLSQQEFQPLRPKIIVFGVGGAGGNALDNMIESNLRGVELIAANTDAQALAGSQAKIKIQLGLNTTEGLGAGSYPETGKLAAEESYDEISKHLEGAHMVFLTAGMGGGTGTGATPVIAKIAKERNIMVVAIVTRPFDTEGIHKQKVANKGIEELRKVVDTLIIVPNQNLFRVSNEQTSLKEAFRKSDNVLYYGIKGITDLITVPGIVNIDFADLKAVMKKMGKAMMGTGEAEGENRAAKAVEEAISNPLLDDVSIKGAKAVIINITGSPDLTLFEFDEISRIINNEVDPEANIITGTVLDSNMGNKIRVSIFATGINDEDSTYYRKNDAEYEDVYDTKNDEKEIISDEENHIQEKIIDVEVDGDKATLEESQKILKIIESNDDKIIKEEEIKIKEELNLDNSKKPQQRIQLLSNVFSSNDLENEKEDGFFLPKQAKKAKDNVLNNKENEKIEEKKNYDEAKKDKKNKENKENNNGLFSFFSSKKDSSNAAILKNDKNMKIIAVENKNPDLNDDIINIPPYLRKKE